jgi:cytidylate kinase
VTSIEAIINRQLLRWEIEQKQPSAAAHEKHRAPQIITVSRQTGSRGSFLASRLAQKLDYVRLHREVIDEISRSSGYRKRLIEALDNHFRSDLEVAVDSVLTGQSVDHTDYMRHMVKVILSMARLGGVVLVGRGGNFVLGPKRGFHIRVVAPELKRIENLMKYCDFSEHDAEKKVLQSDAERAQFVSRVFGRDIDDPANYDLVINTAFIDVEELICVCVEAIKAKYQKLAFLDNDS